MNLLVCTSLLVHIWYNIGRGVESPRHKNSSLLENSAHAR